MSTLQIDRLPDIQPSGLYRLFVDGQEVGVHDAPSYHFALFCGQGTARVEVECLRPFYTATVRPGRLGIQPLYQNNGRLAFDLELPCKATLELNGDLKSPLFLLCNPLLQELPPQDAIVFSPGYHEAGVIAPVSGQTVYLAPGAWVRGCIHMDGQKNIRIMGRGVLDAAQPDEGPKKHAILPSRCQDVTIEGITVVNGPTWHVVPVACQGVVIRDVNIMGHDGTGDGVDIVGSTDVTVRGCFIRVKDDCVAVKAVDYQFPFGERDVRDVLVERCVFWNDEWGNAIEIGYETRCQEIHRIVFRDIDVVHCEREGWQSGGVLTIHNGDRARIHDVLYEDIRVECADEKLIDFKILDSRYSKDTERGSIDHIVIRDVRVIDGPFPVSILRGYEQGHLVEDVTIENLNILGTTVRSFQEGHMVVELTKGLKFC